MNSLSSSQPRFRCQVVRAGRALFDHAGDRHVASCPDCQAYERAAGGLEAELRREGNALRRLSPAPSAELSRRIQRAIREEGIAAESHLGRGGRAVWLAGSFAAAAALALAFYVQRPTSPGRSGASEDAAAVVAVVEQLSVKLRDTVIPAGAEIVADNPLQRELDAVYSDARSAIDFLAMNFLPPVTTASAAPARRS
jgi:hypothetical protein